MSRFITVCLASLPLLACGASPRSDEPSGSAVGDGASGPLPGQLALPGDDDSDTGQTGGTGGGSGDGGQVSPGPDAPAEREPTPVTATSSAANSLLYAMVWRDPSAVGNSLAHDHVVRASEWAGTFTFLKNDPIGCSVDVDIVTASLINDEPALREAVGLDSEMSDRDRASVLDTMLGSEQLDAAGHPTLSFTSVGCRGDFDGAGQLEVDGTLTIHGIARPATWIVEYAVDENGQMIARGSLTVAQSDFGITPYQAFFGAVKVADEVDLAFELTGSPR